MPEHYKNKADCLASLPPETSEDFLPLIQQKLNESRAKIVVLDDDPTGTQTVHDIPVLTTWDVESLCVELKNSETAFFILTNSRALTRTMAIELASEIGDNLNKASRITGIKISIISRSDSTLRGHFPYEVDAVARAMQYEKFPYLICPFFQEGGRLTLDDIHYVAEGEKLVPAAQTPYARDASFGFSNSNLCEWVAEKTRNAIPADNVHRISLSDIRKGGPGWVARKLNDVPDQGACIVNAVSYKDMEVFVTGLLEAQKTGKKFLYRTAASFVRVMAGIRPKGSFLSFKDLTCDTDAGGLFIVGSYVPKTSRQLEELEKEPDLVSIEIDVKKILSTKTDGEEVGRIIFEANQTLKSGKDTLIYTSRELITSKDSDQSRKIGQTVSVSLISIVRGIECQPRYLVAKGGITSSDVATLGLNVKRAMVIGQALPGIPVWRLGNEAVYPGMPYIVFPGNVGDDDALAVVRRRLKKQDR